MKRTLCIILFVLFSLSICGCGRKTIYFDEELKEEEQFLKQATSHFPLSLTCGSEYSNWSTTLEIAEDGSFIGEYLYPDYSDRGDGFENGTFYVSNFSGEFGNYEIVNDYTITLSIYNLTTEKQKDEEWLDVATASRYVAVDPSAITEDEKGYTLYTPSAPKAAVPGEVVGALSYGTSDMIDVYALVCNSTGEVFVEPSSDFGPIF